MTIVLLVILGIDLDSQDMHSAELTHGDFLGEHKSDVAPPDPAPNE